MKRRKHISIDTKNFDDVAKGKTTIDKVFAADHVYTLIQCIVVEGHNSKVYGFV